MQINSLKFNLGVSNVNKVAGWGKSTEVEWGAVYLGAARLSDHLWFGPCPKFNSEHLVNFVKKSKLKWGKKSLARLRKCVDRIAVTFLSLAGRN